MPTLQTSTHSGSIGWAHSKSMRLPQALRPNQMQVNGPHCCTALVRQFNASSTHCQESINSMTMSKPLSKVTLLQRGTLWQNAKVQITSAETRQTDWHISDFPQRTRKIVWLWCVGGRNGWVKRPPHTKLFFFLVETKKIRSKSPARHTDRKHLKNCTHVIGAVERMDTLRPNVVR